jgi:hypothetical protein
VRLSTPPKAMVMIIEGNWMEGNLLTVVEGKGIYQAIPFSDLRSDKTLSQD